MTLYQHIVVPLDGSKLAEKALSPAMRIATSMAERHAGEGGDRVRLVLLRVVSPIMLVAADPMLYDEMSRLGIDEAQAYLNTVRASLPAGQVLVKTEVLTGPPADAIVLYAEEKAVDLILMSSHGRTGSSRWVYGSVAEKVMHHAPCATCIIRAHVSIDMFQNRKILVPLDGSELAEQALEPALAIAAAVDSDVVMLRIVSGREAAPETLTPDGTDLGQGLDTVEASERAEAEGYLQKIYNDRPNRHLFFDVQSSTGDVADTIVSYADAQQIDLIVMSSHGRSGIGRWIHGSVAEKVLRGANCATMIIRKDQA
jgi:nucleotide-binding universal stress UspA family protein